LFLVLGQQAQQLQGPAQALRPGGSRCFVHSEGRWGVGVGNAGIPASRLPVDRIHAAPMGFATLEFESYSAVRRILLAREAQRNAQSQQMLDELMAAFDDAQQDDGVRAVVLGGKGAHFSAGHDLKQAQAERANFTVEERWAYEELRYYDYSL